MPSCLVLFLENHVITKVHNATGLHYVMIKYVKLIIEQFNKTKLINSY